MISNGNVHDRCMLLLWRVKNVLLYVLSTYIYVNIRSLIQNWMEYSNSIFPLNHIIGKDTSFFYKMISDDPFHSCYEVDTHDLIEIHTVNKFKDVQPLFYFYLQI